MKVRNEKLIAMRKQSGKTIAHIAKEVCISIRGYQKYELSGSLPNARTAIRIAEALNTTVEKLWGGNPATK